VDDNYGMNQALRQWVARAFPGSQWDQEKGGLFDVPFAIGFFPKIMEHDGKASQLLRLIMPSGPLDLYYSFRSDLGDGWEDPARHNLPEEKRLLALRMGTNLVALAARCPNAFERH